MTSPISRNSRQTRPSVPAKKNRQKQTLRRRLVYSAVSVILLTGLFFTLPLFKIQSYEIKGTMYSDLGRLSEAATSLKGQNLFFYSAEDLLGEAAQDPYIEKLNISTSITGAAIIQVTEKKREYTLETNDVFLIMDRSGFVLEESLEVPDDVVIVTDTAGRIQPGQKLYKGTAKETLLLEFRRLMDLNLSTIRFDGIDITNLEDIQLKYGGWTVEIGTRDQLQTKMNQAINILKELKADDTGVIDLKFDTAPVIRKKQV